MKLKKAIEFARIRAIREVLDIAVINDDPYNGEDGYVTRRVDNLTPTFIWSAEYVATAPQYVGGDPGVKASTDYWVKNGYYHKYGVCHSTDKYDPIWYDTVSVMALIKDFRRHNGDPDNRKDGQLDENIKALHARIVAAATALPKFQKAARRNSDLTSNYGLTLELFKYPGAGYYIVGEGTRTKVTAYYDSLGQLMTRKPSNLLPPVFERYYGNHCLENGGADYKDLRRGVLC